MATEEFEVAINLRMQDMLRMLDEAATKAEEFDEGWGKLDKTIGQTRSTLGKLFDLLRSGFGDSIVAADHFGASVHALKGVIRDATSAGVAHMDDLKQGMLAVNRITKQFSSAEITTAFEEVAAEAKMLASLKITPESELRAMLDNVAKIKTKIKDLAMTTDASFDDVAEAFKRANKASKEFRVDDVNKAIKELNQSMNKTSKSTLSLRDRVKEFTSSVKQIKSEIKRFKATSTASIEDIISAFKEMNRETKRFSAAEMSQAMRELRNEGRQVNAVMGNLRISTLAWGNILGNLARDALREVVNLMKEFTAEGIAVAETQRKFIIGVRALQRSGMDISFAEANAELEKLGDQFKFFTDRQVKEGLSQIMLLTRNVKLSKEEMFQLAEAAGKLSLITGKDFGEQSFGIARSIASGYTEALQNAGIEASRAAIEFEAAALGINKGFQAMTQQERAAVTLSLVLRQLEDMGEDVELAQASLATQVQFNNARWVQMKETIGNQLLPIYIKLQEVLLGTVEFLRSSFSTVQRGFILGWATLTGVVIGSVATITAALNGQVVTIETRLDAMVMATEQLAKTWTDTLQPAIQDPFQEIDTDIGEAVTFDGVADDIAENAQEEIDKLNDKIDDIWDKFRRDARDAFINLQRKFQDIDIKAGRKREDADKKFGQDVEKLNRTTADKIADAWQKFRDKEIKAEEAFQRKMNNLREKFLFDLEDALRERDAKAVLRLIRQFNMRKNQLVKSAKQDQEQRKKDLQQELRDIQIQRERKMRELQIELQQRMEAIAIAREREIADANMWHARRMEDLIRHRDDRLALLRAEIEETLAMMVAAENAKTAIAAAGEATRAGLRGMRGRGKQSTSGGQGTGSEGTGGGGAGFSFAHGGTLVAKKPTLAMFGEHGAEAVSFTPLHRVGANEGRTFGGSLPGRGGSSGGRAEIEVSLSRDLIAEVKDDTLGEMADLMVREMSQ